MHRGNLHGTLTHAFAMCAMLALFHIGWPSGTVDAATGQDYRAAKGFVTARTATSLTVLVGDRRVVVVIGPTTRVLGRRDSFTEIAVNDVVRAEGQGTAGNRLLANRIDVVFATGTGKLQQPPSTTTIEFLTVKI